MPQYLNVEGVLAARKFRLQEMRTSPPGQIIHHSLSLYEIETDDLEDFKRRFTASHQDRSIGSEDRPTLYTLFFEEIHHWDQTTTPTPHVW